MLHPFDSLKLLQFMGIATPDQLVLPCEHWFGKFLSRDLSKNTNEYQNDKYQNDNKS